MTLTWLKTLDRIEVFKRILFGTTGATGDVSDLIMATKKRAQKVFKNESQSLCKKKF